MTPEQLRKLAGDLNKGTPNEQPGAQDPGPGPHIDLPQEPVEALDNEAMDFLRVWPTQRMHLWAKIPEGRVEARTFDRTDAGYAAAAAWVAERNGKMNVYFVVNDISVTLGVDQREDPKDGKVKPILTPRESDVTRMVASQVDSDPRVNLDAKTPEDCAAHYAEEKTRLLALYDKHEPRLNVIVFTGGGCQGFHLFKEPIVVDGDPEKIAEWKRANVALKRAQGFAGSDDCESLQHVMRLPGTTNLPDERKRKRHRAPAMASFVRFDVDKALWHDAAALPKAEPDPEQNRNASGFSGKSSYEPISRDDPGLKDLDAKWISLGVEGDTEGKYVKADGSPDRSKAAIAFATVCLRAKVEEQVIARVLMDPAWAIGECVRDKGGAVQYHLKRTIERARKFVDADLEKPPLLGRDTWDTTAEQFYARVTEDLIFHNDDFYDHAAEDGCYHDLEKKGVEAMAWRFLKAAKVAVANKDGTTKLAPFHPDKNDVAQLTAALSVDGYKDRDSMAPPCWINGASGPPPRECIAMPNGILHVPTRTMLDATPDFFTVNALAFRFDPNATCPLWLKTLGEWWPRKDGEPTAEEMLLQEMFGYTLTPWRSLQKIFLLLGPGRSGKGTIMRVLGMLLGKRNAAAPTARTLVDTFGRQPLIGKLAALITDAAISNQVDRGEFTGHLKTISGEDDVNINRKNKEEWIGRLFCQFWIAANKMLRFEDDSDAFMNRLVPLQMTISYAGHENDNLTKDLEAELPGIMNWALEGYDRLNKTRKFTETAGGSKIAKDVSRAASPVKSFIEDECSVEDDKATTLEADFYKAYCSWCEAAGIRADRLGEVVSAAQAGNIRIRTFRDMVPCAKCQHPGTCAKGRCAREKEGLKMLRPRSLAGIRLNGAKPAPDPEIPF